MMFYGSKKSILNKAVTKSFNDIETFKWNINFQCYWNI
jgi:hypothetical protein